MSAAAADETQSLPVEQINFFETKIRPVLVEHCYKCHSAEAKIVQGGLKLDIGMVCSKAGTAVP